MHEVYCERERSNPGPARSMYVDDKNYVQDLDRHAVARGDDVELFFIYRAPRGFPGGELLAATDFGASTGVIP